MLFAFARQGNDSKPWNDYFKVWNNDFMTWNDDFTPWNDKACWEIVKCVWAKRNAYPCMAIKVEWGARMSLCPVLHYKVTAFC